MKKRTNLVGQKYGRLTVVGPAEDCVQPSGQKKAQWECQCDCGVVVTVRSGDMRNGHTSSCGCYNREATSSRRTVHGQARAGIQSTNYKLWFSIKQRCCNPRNKRYPDYGGRGVRMFPQWKDSFMEFDAYILGSLGPRPPGLTLDRIDNERGYLPGNLRWATYKQQSNNRRPRRKNGKQT